MKKLERIICCILFICILAHSSIKVNATELRKSSDSNASSSIDLITKNTQTGEFTYSTFTSEPISNQYNQTRSHENNLYTERTQSWFPVEPVYDNLSDNTFSPFTVFPNLPERQKVNNTTIFPYSAICYFEVKYENGDTGYGTAFMISKNIALTAGHLLYDHEYGWAEECKITPGKNGYGIWNNPYGTDADLTITASANWVNEGAPTYDWGIIETSTNIGEQTGWLGVGWSESSFVGTSVTISGYPHSNEDNNYQYYQYKMSGTITISTALLLYTDNISTSDGQSGSPIFTSDYTACGIYAAGYSTDNSGPRITKSMYDLFVYCINNAE